MVSIIFFLYINLGLQFTQHEALASDTSA